MPEQWRLEGMYAEACTCEAACPCAMLNDPTYGTCTAVVGWRIDEGNYGDVVALHSPGNMADDNWKAALYLDDGAGPEQQEALGNIFGGHPGELAKLIGEAPGVAVVPLTFEADGKTTTALGAGSRHEAHAIAPDGKIVVARHDRFLTVNRWRGSLSRDERKERTP